MKQSLRVCLWIFCCFYFSLHGQDTIPAAQVPNHTPLESYPALLWEISGNNLSTPSYIYGALETSDKLAYHLTDSFFLTFRQSNRLMLEMHPDSVRKAMQDPAILRRAYKRVFSTRYEPSSGGYYSLLQPESFEEDIFEGVLAGHLGWGGLGASDMDEEKTLTDFMYMAALKLNKPIIGAMSFTEQLDFNDIHEKVQKEARKKSRNTRTDYQVYRSNVTKAYDAYRRGDIGLLDSMYKQIMDNPEYFIQVKTPMAQLIANRISEEITTGNVFVVVDVTTMAGDKGIIEFLRQAGYTLRPIQHEVLTRPNKQKEDLERMTTRTKYSVYTSDTRFWSLSVPEHTLASVNERNGQAWFTDHLNDAVYAVTRYTTNSELSFQSPEYLLERMDSVIYEYVPGKIVKRKDIRVQGYPGIEILNRSAKGQYEQARLIITPLEVISFRVSGPKSVIKKRKAGQRLLNSANIYPPNSTWTQVTSGHGEYSVQLPSYHIVDSITNRVFLSPDITYQAWDPVSSSYFMFRRNLHHDLFYLEEDTFDLNYMAEQIAHRLKRELDLSAPATFQGYPSVDFSLTMKEEGKDTLFCKLILRGAAHYLMLARTGDSDLREKFFNGLTFQPFSYEMQDETVIDSALMYTVVSPVSKQEIDTEDEEEEYYSWMSDDEEDDKSYEAAFKEATYFFDSGAEYIKVERKKEHDYVSYRSYHELWTELIKSEKRADSTLIVHHRTDDSLAPSPFLDIQFRGPGTGREIRKKYIIHHAFIYTLETMYDTLAGQLPFTEKFFSTFSPTGDSLPGRSLFEDKGFLFVTNFLSTDTNKVKEAIQSISEVKFSGRHGDTLLYIIGNKDIMSRNLDVSKQIIDAYAGIKAKNALQELRKLYTYYEGNPGIQMGLFRAIAIQSDTLMPSTLLEIMSKDLPLPLSVSHILSLRRPLMRQKELAATLYPDLVQYLRYPEYSRLVIELLSALIESRSYQPAVKDAKSVLVAMEQRLDEEMRLRRMVNQVDPADPKALFKQQFVSISDFWWDDEDDAEEEIIIEEEMEEEMLEEMYELLELVSDFQTDADTAASGDMNKRPGIFIPDVVHLIRILDALKGENAWRKGVTDQLLNGKNRNEAIAMCLYMTEKGETVHDSIWRNLSADTKTRTVLYRELHRIKATHLFDTTYLSPQHFAEGYYTISQRVTPDDSLTYLGSRQISTPLTSGRMYFYKVKSGYGTDKEWYISMVGVISDSTGLLHRRPVVITETDEQIFPGDEIEELIDKQMKKLRKLHRKRFSNYNDYDFDDEYFLEEMGF